MGYVLDILNSSTMILVVGPPNFTLGGEIPVMSLQSAWPSCSPVIVSTVVCKLDCASLGHIWSQYINCKGCFTFAGDNYLVFLADSNFG